MSSPEYPFHMMVADYCDIKGKMWLVTADRFTGWVSVFYFLGAASSKELIKVFRDMFTTFLSRKKSPRTVAHSLSLIIWYYF